MFTRSKLFLLVYFDFIKLNDSQPPFAFTLPGALSDLLSPVLWCGWQALFDYFGGLGV
jgi:hypothetical protein